MRQQAAGETRPLFCGGAFALAPNRESPAESAAVVLHIAEKAGKLIPADVRGGQSNLLIYITRM